MITGVRVSGLKFVNPAGERIPKVMVSDYALLKRDRMRNGRTALTMPRLDEWHHLALDGGYEGSIWLRVFREAHPNNAFGFGPPELTPGGILKWQQDLRNLSEFVGHHPARDFYIEWTAGDYQHLYPTSPKSEDANPSVMQQTLNEACAALVDLPNVTLEELNERWKNGRQYDIASPQWGIIHPLIRAHGYYADTSQWPKLYARDYITFHTDRTVDMMRWPKLLYDMPVSIAVLHNYFAKPVDLNEPYRFEEYSDPKWAALMGSMIAWTAGVCFHSQRGRDGDGFHQTPVQREAAIQFFKGVAAGLKVGAL